jgi:transcriptional regulator with XRE-family HTH domain
LRSPLRTPLFALGKAIRFFRLDANLTQRQVAERSGKHLTYISRLEKGHANPTHETMQDIARSLGVTSGQIQILAEAFAGKAKG